MPRTRALPRQLLLPVPSTWGGRRAGAGRRPGARPIVLHRTRPDHRAAHPVHVTLRARAGLPTFRGPRLFPPIREALRRASGETFRVLHFSVQSNHLHLLVEAESRDALSRGVQGLAVRIARAINRALARRGRVFAERYHARALGTPREVRHALVYVLMNFKKHGVEARAVDPCSSAPWFAGWKSQPLARFPRRVEAPVAVARTWLLRVGWMRYGLVGLDEAPRAS